MGPTRLAYGTVIAAGCVYRKDELRPGRLLASGDGRAVNIPHSGGIYRSVKRVVKNNIIYIANLLALKEWYTHVRSEFVSENFPEPLLSGLQDKVDMAISERLKRMGAFSEKLVESADKYRDQMKEKASGTLLAQKHELNEKWPEIRETMPIGNATADFLESRDAFLSEVQKEIRTAGKDYLTAIRRLDVHVVDRGTQWLQGYVDAVSRNAFKLLPSYGFLK